MLNIEKQAQEIDFIYRPTLNIPSTVLFGTEIEFVKALHEEVIQQIEIFNSTDKTKYSKVKSYYGDLFNYDKWKCVWDCTVNEKDENGNLYGGEINSPILSNKYEHFEALSKICDLLINVPEISINRRCGIHIQVDRTIYGNEAKPFLRLLKIWMLFEDIIYRFSYGEGKSARSSINSYARPINEKIYSKLDKLVQMENETFESVIKDFKNKKQGLSFYYTSNNIQKLLNTIEIRTFNGTLNKVIIQNNINFIIHLLLYALSEEYDEEYIDYEIKRFQPIELKSFGRKNPTKALTLSNLIYKDELEQLYFMKQYLKCFKKEEIVVPQQKRILLINK